MFRFQRLLLLPVLVLAPACASAGSKTGENLQLLVTLHNYRASERFELASESHTERVAYYSDKRADAARKIQTDEVMAAFLRELERLGLEAHARAGPAPSLDASEVIRWGLEVASGSGAVHWLVGTGSSPADWKEFDQCRNTFLQLYNATVSYQAVENKSGQQFFDDKTRPASGQKKK